MFNCFKKRKKKEPNFMSYDYPDWEKITLLLFKL
jgi:hypothetical protein